LRIADAVFDDAVDGAVGPPADHQRYGVTIDRPRCDRVVGARDRLATPGAVHEVEGRVEPLAAVFEVEAGGGEVVWPRTDTKSEHEPPARYLVQTCGLLGEQDRFADGGEQDVCHQANPLGDARRGTQRHELVVARVRDAPDGGER
jgi:hypothetical protein